MYFVHVLASAWIPCPKDGILCFPQGQLLPPHRLPTCPAEAEWTTLQNRRPFHSWLPSLVSPVCSHRCPSQDAQTIPMASLMMASSHWTPVGGDLHIRCRKTLAHKLQEDREPCLGLLTSAHCQAQHTEVLLKQDLQKRGRKEKREGNLKRSQGEVKVTHRSFSLV